MNRILAAAILFLILPAAIHAQEPIRFVRTPDISPDGKTVAFSYLGDIWTRRCQGRRRPAFDDAREARLSTPSSAPTANGSRSPPIATGNTTSSSFPSKAAGRNGSPSTPPTIIRTGWSPDSQNVLFMSSRDIDLPSRSSCSRCRSTAGQPKRISAFEGPRRQLFARGQSDRLRARAGPLVSQGLSRLLQRRHLDLQRRRLEESPDHQSQRAGQLPDVVARRQAALLRQRCRRRSGEPRSSIAVDGSRIADQVPTPQALTHHKDDSVRRARISANGEWIVYECGPDIWIHSVKDGKSRKLNIEVNADDKTEPGDAQDLHDRRRPNSPGRPMKSSRRLRRPRRNLSDAARRAARRNGSPITPAFDHGIAWSPDGKKMLFLSDRDGHEDIYPLEPDDPEHPT